MRLLKITLLVLLWGFRANSSDELLKQAETIWTQAILNATTAQQIQQLSTQINEVRSLSWRCDRQRKDRQLPYSCYELVFKIKNSTLFQDISTKSFLVSLEESCVVALHHRVFGFSRHLGQYQQVPWPTGNRCKEQIIEELQRFQYRKSSPYLYK